MFQYIDTSRLMNMMDIVYFYYYPCFENSQLNCLKLVIDNRDRSSDVIKNRLQQHNNFLFVVCLFVCSSRSEVNKSVGPSRVEGPSIARAARIRAKNIFISIYISMKVSVLLPGNSANTVCLTSEKGKVARQQQVVRQAGVRGNLQLLCNWSKAARTGNYKR